MNSNSGSSGGTALPPIHSYRPQHDQRTPSPSSSSSAAGGQPLSPPLQQQQQAPSVTPTAGPRNTKARACTNCKTKKIACRPSTVAGVCTKCQRDNKRCIVEEPTPRPVRGKGTSKARVAEMEKKLDGLVALLTGAKNISPNTNNNDGSAANLSDQEQAAIGLANLAPSLSRLYGLGDGESANKATNNDTPMFDFAGAVCCKAKDEEAESLKRQGQEAEDQRRRQSSSGRDSNVFMMPPPSKIPLEDVISRNLLTEAEATENLTIFADMVTHFPFYVLPAEETVASLRASKPILLMAILTTASGRNKRVQVALERDFRRVFSEKILVNGEKRLELLQAGLIYLAWFQCHFSPKTQIFLQLMHLMISLVTELGYDQKPNRDRNLIGGGADANMASPGYSENGTEIVEPPEKIELRELRSKEIRRAFLGTWWLTNSVSMAFRKRIPLHYSSFMRRCQQSFEVNPEFESDKYMVMMLKLQKFQEDICETFKYHDQEIAGKQDILRIQMNLKAFNSQLKELERELQFLDPRHPTYDAVYTTFPLLGMYLNEIGLHMTPPPPSTSPFAPTNSLEFTAERINIMSDCLSYTKKYLECITTREPHTYGKLSAASWMSMSYGLVVLSKLALGSTEPVDLCNIKENTIIQYSNDKSTLLKPHPAIVEQAIREEKERLNRRREAGIRRSPSPESSKPGIAFIPSPTNVDGWDTSVVRAAVRMDVYLDRLVELCKVLHRPQEAIKEEDRERYRANGVEDVVGPDIYDFGVWMFGTMKEWYLAMVRREEEIEDAVRDAVSATPGSATMGSISAGSGSTGGSIVSGVMEGAATARTRSTSISIMTPTPPTGSGGGAGGDWYQPSHSLQGLKRKYDATDRSSGRMGVAPTGGMGGEYGSPGGSGTGGGMPGNNMNSIEMGLPPSMGFDMLDAGSGDDFWGAMWSSWPLFYPGA
ncbi:hypothetical protein AA313_de0203352 [Arthrobotrys entomopaga]|nr:hypothetical protein AA313_de0203352 [Arthrobotrys entomopaga]